MAQQAIFVTTPVGRIVMGDLYDPSTTNAEGQPLVTKTGPNAGQPRVSYWFALAIPKGTEQHWASTEWGAKIWQVGHAAFPQAAQSPAFAWKVEDGDSQIPNMKGRKPCDNEGWKGHWILKCSNGFAPKIYRIEGSGYVQITEKDWIKAGYYVQVQISVQGNGSAQKPGVYLNHSQICFRGYGPEITFGPDVAAAGFGAAPLPAGASATPPAGAMPMPAAAPSVPGVPQVPGVPAIPGVPQMPAVPQGAPAVPGVPAAGIPAVPGVTPNPAFLNVPGGVPSVPQVPVAPVAPPVAPVAPPARQMTPAANGTPYEAFIAGGWTDAQLISNGYMLP